MTPWTALLESLHSALIDELTERHPEPKPTLGMPTRHQNFTAPPATSRLILSEAAFDSARGFAALAFQPGFILALGVSAPDFWQAILKRAGSEFLRRGIKPRLGPPLELGAGDPLPKGLPEPTRVIWIPFQIPGGNCYLGLGA